MKYFPKAPILYLVFNRPDLTAKTFKQIQKYKPKKLYISSDGPRQDNDTDLKKIEEVRYIVGSVDWKCEVKTLFRKKNLGCKKAVSEAILWFFKNEEQGIILEDDCLPHKDFFIFCETMLKRYRYDRRVFMITGHNVQNRIKRGEASYYFSNYPACWGWASWRRSLKYYDVNMLCWKKWKTSSNWKEKFSDHLEKKYWENIFNLVHLNKIDTWDYQLTACCWRQDGLTIVPNVNFISNIGFGKNATHTHDVKNPNFNNPVYSIGKISHPSRIIINREADIHTFYNHYLIQNKNQKFHYKLFNLLKSYLIKLCKNIFKLK